MATAPDPPRNKSQPFAANQSLTFSWEPPLNNGGSPITLYIIAIYGDPGYSGLVVSDGAGPNERQKTFGSAYLTNGVTYYSRITALNAVGTSAPAYFRPFQAGNLPGPPASATASAVGTDAIFVSWTAPLVSPDATIFWYVLTVADSTTNETVSRWTADGQTQTSYLIPNVAPGSYTVYVQAVNCPGYSSKVNAGTVNVSAGLQLWLRGSSWNNTSTWTDSSPNGNDATLAAGTSAGNGGNSVVFDGSTYWTFPSLGPLPVFTVTAWYYNTGSYGNGVLPTIVTEQVGGGYVNYALTFNQVLGTSGQWSGGTFASGWYIGTQFSISNNTWTHMAYTYDGNDIITYVNGTSVGTVTIGAVNPSTSGLPGRIGRRWDSANYITGRIGEIRIYNTALSAGEIASLYTSTQGSFP